MVVSVFFFQAEDGIRDLVRSRGLGDVYKRQVQPRAIATNVPGEQREVDEREDVVDGVVVLGDAELSLIHI